MRTRGIVVAMVTMSLASPAAARSSTTMPTCSMRWIVMC